LPLTIPPFNQYQSPIVPLRGLWNAAPVEGDKFVAAEIDWLVTTTQQAVQFAISGNSPVSFSQITALVVDNSRCGSDVDFVFSDSGFVLTVPAHNQVIAPVFTNGLMFYVVAATADAGDVTIFQVLNSMPPTLQLAPVDTQNHSLTAGIALANGSTQVVPASVSGSLNALSITIPFTTASTIQINLTDGTGKNVWAGFWDEPAVFTLVFNLSGLNVRFTNGLSLVISNSGLTGVGGVVNLYYTSP
jgi:hypothetical protein